MSKDIIFRGAATAIVTHCHLPLCDLDSTNKERLLQTLKEYGFIDKNVKAGSVTIHQAVTKNIF